MKTKQVLLFATKSDSKRTLSTEDVIKIFETSDDMKKIKNAVENAEERLYTTWASVETKDNAGELIPMDDIVKQQDILLERNGPISDTHTNRIIGETVAYKILEHPKSKTTGCMHLEKIFNHHEFDDKIWSEIQSGERTGSSVGGYNDSVSDGIDPDTKEQVKVLDGFHQFETASVDEPCNPLALNEFISVAKSNSRGVKKSDELELEEIRKKFLSDEEVPEDERIGIEKQPDEEIDSEEKTKKSKTNINKGDIVTSITNVLLKIKKGDIMSEDIKKDVSEILKLVKSQDARLTKLEKQEEEPADPVEEEEPTEEEKKKAAAKKEEDEPADPVEEEEEEPTEEGKKKTKKEEEEPADPVEEEDEEPTEEEKKKAAAEKEDAASDIDGEEDAPAPDSPDPDSPNDEDAFKSKEAIQKMIDSTVKKVMTPLPMGAEETKKEGKFAKLPLDLAMGKTKMTHVMVNKANNEHIARQGGASQ